MNPLRAAQVLAWCGCMAAVLGAAQSAPPGGSAQPSAQLRGEIARRFPGTKPEDIRPTPLPGVFEVSRGTDIVYVSADARFAIAGDLYDLSQDFENLSEKRRRDVRARLINAVPDSQAVVFAPKQAKYTVTVFTDIDCSYCR
ncbi:MAG: hypothetical protein NZM12_11940, partial [Steroidobacteraceae bacterium]|nr:hypothetical protein [Steroidobacteraceae bacterium]